MTEARHYDVAIIGGGPAGSTTASLLKKYAPHLKVVIFEKEKFPRDHVGESQLPTIGYVLHEMGCWDKVEAANFPIKIGATYVWGKSGEPWDFEFVPLSRVPKDAPRPSTFEGVRRNTAFQVDRAVYDDILLRHAEELGTEVHEETLVRSIETTGDRIDSMTLHDGTVVTARYYLDGSGHHGVLRRALGVEAHVPTSLMNIAIWDYWTDAEWATTIGNGGTRVQVLSLPTGWCWFIPIAPDRTSIGFICPASYFKDSDKTPEELYQWAIETQPRVKHLTRNAKRENRLATTKDWSFLSDRMVGENWYLMGEAAGFADPILAGGMTLAHDSARHVAYAILEKEHDEVDPKWIDRHYEESLSQRIRQFIRFADFWYASNGQFSELQDFTTQIAEDAGMSLNPQAAFRWLSLGGFNTADGSRPGIGGLDLGAVREVTSIFTTNSRLGWKINDFNVFKLDLMGAEEDFAPVLHEGRIEKRPCWRRGKKVLPRTGIFGHVLETLEQATDFPAIIQKLQHRISLYGGFNIHDAVSTLETMLIDGWIVGKLNKKKQRVRYDPDASGIESNFHANEDAIPGLPKGQ